MALDRSAVSALVKDLSLNESLLQDLDRYYETGCDQVSQQTLLLTHLQSDSQRQTSAVL